MAQIKIVDGIGRVSLANMKVNTDVFEDKQPLYIYNSSGKYIGECKADGTTPTKDLNITWADAEQVVVPDTPTLTFDTSETNIFLVTLSDTAGRSVVLESLNLRSDGLITLENVNGNTLTLPNALTHYRVGRQGAVTTIPLPSAPLVNSVAQPYRVSIGFRKLTETVVEWGVLTFLDEAVSGGSGDGHTHDNKALLDSIINSGDGTKYLADDGTYKTVTSGTSTTIDQTRNQSTTSVPSSKLMDDELTKLVWGETVPFSAINTFNGNKMMFLGGGNDTFDTNHVLTEAGSGNKRETFLTIYVVGNGTNTITMGTGWKNVTGGAFDPGNGKLNEIMMRYIGPSIKLYTITQPQ